MYRTSQTYFCVYINVMEKRFQYVPCLEYLTPTTFHHINMYVGTTFVIDMRERQRDKWEETQTDKETRRL
jgi:hypothetical protein